MRVALISTVDRQGGAARAAFRLHCGLNELGIHSTMLVQQKTSDDPRVLEVTSPPGPGTEFWRFIQEGCLDLNRSGFWNTYFSLGVSGVDLSRHPVIQAADVINLHWVAGFQGVGNIRRLQELGKPIIWTLHDQRAFTGGCHFAFDCRGFESGCRTCPQLKDDPVALPAAILSDAGSSLLPRNLEVITPSHWLASEARRSRLLRQVPVATIPYGVDTRVFQPMNRSEACSSLGLAPDARYLLFGADYGAERRKGFAELVEALRHCLGNTDFRRACEEQKVVLLCFGRPNDQLASLGIPTLPLGYIGDEARLARVYAAADLFLLPSLADNLPCTLLESLACGTPAVAFGVGGIPELIEDGVNGRLVQINDTRGFGDGIRELLQAPDRLAHMSDASRSRIESGFTQRSQAEAYARLFRDLSAAPILKEAASGFGNVGPSVLKLAPQLARLSSARRLLAHPADRRRQWLDRRFSGLGAAGDANPPSVDQWERLLKTSRQSRWHRAVDDLRSWLRPGRGIGR